MQMFLPAQLVTYSNNEIYQITLISLFLLGVWQIQYSHNKTYNKPTRAVTDKGP